MKLATTALALFLLAPLAGDQLSFGPKEGTRLTKRFEMSMQLEKRSMSLKIGGREMPPEATENARMDMKSVRTVEVEDEYVALDGERPTELKRDYTRVSEDESSTIQMVGMPEPKEETKEKRSELEGKTVVFRWKPSEKEYAKAWDGDGAGDELLAGLEEEMDLRRLLPGKEVAEGDTWEIDVRDFDSLLGPGGKLGLAKDGDDDHQFEDNATGVAKCTYKGVVEERGRKLANIGVECKVKSFMDMAKDDSQKRRMDFEVTLEGDCYWDLEARHFSHHAFEGDVKAELAMQESLDMGGRVHELEMKVELGGKMALKAEFTRP